MFDRLFLTGRIAARRDMLETLPVHVGVLLDGRPAELDILAVTRILPRNNLDVWWRYVTVDVPLVELARWGHQQAGTPWEKCAIS